jgi:hypothetical protein
MDKAAMVAAGQHRLVRDAVGWGLDAVASALLPRRT